MHSNRRHFVQTAAAAVAAPFVHAQSRDRKYRTALIGTGWWGMNILRCAIKAGESKVVAMCDVDPNYLDPAAGEVQKLSGDQPNKYRDFREMLAKEKPEIVIVGTPDHWHALAMIEAVKANAHVYVEKPIGHTILEGRAMVKAARETQRVVQVGLHRRISPHNVSGIQFLKSGRAGKIGMVRAFVHSAGGPGQTTPDSDPPSGMDWNMWCGPAPYRPFNKAIHPRGHRQFLAYANGTIADWGVHWFDQVLFWTEEKYPKRVFSMGARHIKHDSSDAPDTLSALFEFESFMLEWEHRTYAGNEAEKAPLGAYFYGTEGTFHMGWQDGWTFYPAKKGAPVIHEDPKLGMPDHQNIQELWGDFLDAIKTGRRPVADIEVAHRSTNVSLLGIMSFKLGRSILWDGQTDRVVNDAEANRLLRRDYRAPWKYPEA